ncbi:hypothetical protein M0638_25065 [Roseomonas sp. NAR14]|uniref:Uncharacterized protein n=1 Tax=Roseomonas acroporae TaxID=2937791 RepID=A0A9X1YD83_9PROT|nr:hypothetical protein [Roseomonas acroporae]MCK8787642.1 hypothetical protein [Roseomonas acroporae]
MPADAFTAMVGVLHRDPNLSVAAVYTAPGGVATPVRVVRANLDTDTSGSGSPVAQSIAVFEVLKAALPGPPVKNATLAVGGEMLRVYQFGQDELRLCWRLFCQ